VVRFEFDDYKNGITQEQKEFLYEMIFHERKNGVSGYYELPYDNGLIQAIKSYAQSDFLQKVSDIVVIGIGGSSLGTKAIYSALKNVQSLKRMHFFENSDPLDIQTRLQTLQKQNALFIVVSKSGTTIETISIFKTLCEQLAIDFEKDSKHIVTISEKESKLTRFANEYGIQSFYIDQNVGGRFSVLSAVGLVPLALAGVDIQKLQNGAKEQMDKFFAKAHDDVIDKAYFFAKSSRLYHINVMFAYVNALYDFTKWYVQLWAESLGKIDFVGKSVGFTPVGLIGATDQHSFLQLINEGEKNKTVTFLTLSDYDSNLAVADKSLKHLEALDYVNGVKFEDMINFQMRSTMQSMKKLHIPVDTIELDRLSEYNIAALIVYFELLTSCTGALLRINTYDQPGVQEGKKIFKEMFHK